MTSAKIEFHFDKKCESSNNILVIKLELQKAVKRLNAQGINISNPQLIAHEGDLKEKV